MDGLGNFMVYSVDFVICSFELFGFIFLRMGGWDGFR